MMNSRRRSRGRDSSSSSSSKIDSHKKPHHHRHHDYNSRDSYSHVTPNRDSDQHLVGKRSNFVSYLELPSLTPKVTILCQIVAETPAATLERVLEDTGIRVSCGDVEQVLKFSYGSPGSAMKFFRWASFQLNNRHSPCAWDLIVDMLGKNLLFDAMWDAIKSMKKESLLSLATFKLVFVNYVIADRVQDGIMSFEAIDQYGILRDVAALNSLLYAICRHAKTQMAEDYFKNVKDKIRGNAETYAILLEGWEREGDVGRSGKTFSEMVIDIGWDKLNVRAYDSFLCTLIKGREGMREVLKHFEAMTERDCCPSMKFFKFCIDECERKSDVKSAKVVWDAMIRKKICLPDTVMCRSLITLYCNAKDFDAAEKLLDGMVYYKAFPDSETYGLLYHFLIKHKRLREATPIYKKMDQNKSLCPSWHICNLIADVAMQSDNSELTFYALEFMDKWIARGKAARPPALLSGEGFVVAALGTAGRTYNSRLLDGAWAVLKRSLRQEQIPGPEAYLEKIYAYTKIGNLPKAFGTLREFEAAYESSDFEDVKDLFSPFHSLNPLVISCCRNGFTSSDSVYYLLANLGQATLLASSKIRVLGTRLSKAGSIVTPQSAKGMEDNENGKVMLKGRSCLGSVKEKERNEKKWTSSNTHMLSLLYD